MISIKDWLEKVSGVGDLERTVFIQSLQALDTINHKAAAELALKRFARPRRWPQTENEKALAEKGTLVEFRCGLSGTRFCDAMGLSPEARHHFVQLVSYKVGINSRDFLLANYFARIKTPTLLIHDKNDKELPFSESEELALSNPLSRLILTEGLGHRRILKSPLLVEKCLEFL